MKLEEALALMREGNKITLPELAKENIYFMTAHSDYCKYRFQNLTDEEYIRFEKYNCSPDLLKIVKIRGGHLHDDMKLFRPISSVCKHGPFPQIPLYYLMRDDWFIVEDDKEIIE